METKRPNRLETALGGMLQDIGKFMQRAYGAVRHLDPKIRARDSVLLPTDGHSGYTHKHVLWTEAFFQWLEEEGLHFPAGINRDRVRDMAVFHHKPDAYGALGWLAAEADRLSSGMDRKPKDEELESTLEQPKGWNAFIKTALLSPFYPVDLGQGKAPLRYQQLAELHPDDRLLPLAEADTDHYPERYAALWQAFTAEFKTLCTLDQADLFCEGLLSLSERYTWAIPSSTTDLPDIALHDHNRTVAAIATCLHAWHEAHGSLDSATAIRDRSQPKFRLLAGDLSGIQSTLFTLANQQVKGVNKILRARSFLLDRLVEAAALRCRQVLALPPFNLLQNAGGRFVLLVADSDTLPATATTLQTELDTWLYERYLGQLALNLALSEPFGGNGFIPPHFQAVQDGLARKLEEAKQQPLRHCATGVIALDYGDGECQACGVRPARHHEGDMRRCTVCHEEHQVGGWLPKTAAISWQTRAPHANDWALPFTGGLNLYFHDHDTALPAARSVHSGFRLYGGDTTPPGPWPLHFIANYVPRLSEADAHHPLYAKLSAEAQSAGPGDLKTFEHLAVDALELDADGDPLGKPFLAVLKADVDRLGMVFGFGLRDPQATSRDRATVSRYAALSRLLDLFFTGYLQERLRRRHPHTYTVYAGGDDLLLIGPWRQMIDLAQDLNNQFRRYIGDNPNITLSAGLALLKANQPLNRTVWEAEERLERAKDGGRNRFCLIDEQPLTWQNLPTLLQRAEQLNEWLRDKTVTTALIYKLLYFADQRRRAEDPRQADLSCANWRARWGYHLARNIREKKLPAEVLSTMNQLMGLDERIQKQGQWVTPRIPASIALYRNRS